MPWLDPMAVVHRLSIRQDMSPKMQSQLHFCPELILEIVNDVNKLIDLGWIHS